MVYISLLPNDSWESPYKIYLLLEENSQQIQYGKVNNAKMHYPLINYPIWGPWDYMGYPFGYGYGYPLGPVIIVQPPSGMIKDMLS